MVDPPSPAVGADAPAEADVYRYVEVESAALLPNPCDSARASGYVAIDTITREAGMRKTFVQMLLMIPVFAALNGAAVARTVPRPMLHDVARPDALVDTRLVDVRSPLILGRPVHLEEDSDDTPNTTPNKKALIGSWVETVIFPPEFERPPVLSLASYHEDQTFTHSDQGGVTLVPQEVYSSGRGIWRHVGGRVFEYTSRMLISDLSGNLIGQLKFRGTFTVSESGNEYAGTTVAQILDAAGTPLFAVEVTNTAERIRFDEP
ncbi:hypothetical protein LuPra_02154 [Luteitalea pratensis]|uniref:Uncharacterized protein n=2 Tax=Luteitalea pratensis TaxID=1855912 RepID=A0A143PLH6_LUTPR|nr:hypothetical protein LuPra_02154 [Luteitalea pratensis]